MKPFKYLALFLLAMSMTSSCVDKNYDLSKIDSTVHIAADLEISLGGTEEIKIGDLINSLGEDIGEFLSVNERGDYCIRMVDTISTNNRKETITSKAPSGIATKSFDIGEGEFRVKVTVEIEQINYYHIPELPDILLKGSFDLYDYIIILDITNPGLQALLEFDIASCSYAEDGTSQETILHMPTEGHILIPETGGKICISQRGRYAEEHNLDCPEFQVELSRLFQPIPYQFALKQALFRVISEKFSSDDLDILKAGLSYMIEVPLAFGKELNISYQHRLENLGEQLQALWDEALDFDIKSMEISCNIENTLPLGVAIAATPLDKEGNPIENLKIDLQDCVNPGSIFQVSNNLFRIEISGDMKTLQQLDALDLTLAVNSNEDAEGIPLNANQWVKISDLKAKLCANVNADIAHM